MTRAQARDLFSKLILSLLVGGLAGLIGFIQWPHAQLGGRDGTVVGLLSGVSWVMASLIDAMSRWNNFFNLLAAVLAAMAVGYLAPAKAVCLPTLNGWDTLPIFRAACDLREHVTGVGPAEMLQSPG